jgi:hypothetical protein
MVRQKVSGTLDCLQTRCRHQKAGCLSYSFAMSKAPKHPSQRDDLKRWDNEGGAPRSGHTSHEPHLAPKHEAEPALYYFNLRTESGVIEDPEGDTFPSLDAARQDALTKARAMIVDGNQKGEDRQSWRFEIMDRANQPVLTVAFAEVSDPKATSQSGGR